MLTALVDTSLLLDAAAGKLEIFGKLGVLMDGPFEAVVPQGAVAELERKAREKGRKGAEGRFALAMVNGAVAKNAARIEASEGHVDDWLLSRAKELGTGAIICTNDAGLRRRAKQAGVRVIAIMHNSKLGYA
jgi:rRNA-processing protein FCF1